MKAVLIYFAALTCSAGLAYSQAATGLNSHAEQPGAESIACTQLNSMVVAQVASGQIQDAEAALSQALTPGSNQLQGACAGVLWHNLAAILLNSGRLTDAERTAEQALTHLRRSYSSTDPVLLRPLQILASARFQQGKIGAARQAFERMQMIRAVRPQDRALVHGMAAPLLMTEGKESEAEAEYLAAIADIQQTGAIDSAGAATTFTGLASLYLRQQRFADARRALDQAVTIFTSATDAFPADLVTLLGVRAQLHTRLAEWRDAETDLVRAISLSEQGSQIDAPVLKSLLTDYAIVLQKLHRRRDARRVQARLGLLESHSAGVVDVTELVPGSQSRSSK